MASDLKTETLACTLAVLEFKKQFLERPLCPTEYHSQQTKEPQFAGRTDIDLVREFFGFHQIEATPENLQ